MIILCQRCRRWNRGEETLLPGFVFNCGQCGQALFNVPALPNEPEGEEECLPDTVLDVYLDSPPEWLSCPDCQVGYRFVVCPHCKGKPGRLCPACDGEYQWLERCGTCEGIGQLPGPVAARVVRERRREEEARRQAREEAIRRAREENEAALHAFRKVRERARGRVRET
jgi:hypothetical protein